MHFISCLGRSDLYMWWDRTASGDTENRSLFRKLSLADCSGASGMLWSHFTVRAVKKSKVWQKWKPFAARCISWVLRDAGGVCGNWRLHSSQWCCSGLRSSEPLLVVMCDAADFLFWCNANWNQRRRIPGKGNKNEAISNYGYEMTTFCYSLMKSNSLSINSAQSNAFRIGTVLYKTTIKRQRNMLIDSSAPESGSLQFFLQPFANITRSVVAVFRGDEGSTHDCAFAHVQLSSPCTSPHWRRACVVGSHSTAFI